MSTWAEMRVGHITSARLLLISSWFVLAWLFSRLADYYEPTWHNILPHFKNSDTEGNHQRIHTLYIWNLNHFDMDFYQILIFHSFFFLLSAKPCQRTGRGLLCSSDSLWISVRGFHTAEKLNNCRKTDRLSSKCHVSLNESQRWLFFPMMATDNSVQNLSPGAHLHSNKPLTSCSPLCSFSFFFLTFSYRKQIAFQSRQRGDNLSIQSKSFTLRNWRFISYFTGGLQLYRNLCMGLHALHSTWPKMKYLVILNGDLQETCQKKKKE